MYEFKKMTQWFKFNEYISKQPNKFECYMLMVHNVEKIVIFVFIFIRLAFEK